MERYLCSTHTLMCPLWSLSSPEIWVWAGVPRLQNRSCCACFLYKITPLAEEMRIGNCKSVLSKEPPWADGTSPYQVGCPLCCLPVHPGPRRLPQMAREAGDVTGAQDRFGGQRRSSFSETRQGGGVVQALRLAWCRCNLGPRFHGHPPPPCLWVSRAFWSCRLR